MGRIQPFASDTGTTNAMIAAAPPVAKVMRDACQFVGNTPVAVHNASFDKKFWEAELARLELAKATPRRASELNGNQMGFALVDSTILLSDV